MPDASKTKKRRNGSSTKNEGSPSSSKGDSPASPKKAAEMAYQWRDTGPEVRVTLQTGPLPAAATGRLRLTCTERHVRLCLPDGRRWESRLFATVLPDGSDCQYKAGRVTVSLMKLDPALAWTALQPIKIPRVKPVPTTKQMKDKSNAKKSQEISESQTVPAEPVNGFVNGSGEPDKEPVQSVEPLVLDNVKHDIFETDSEIRVSIYVKHVQNETLSVKYEPDSFTVVFSTSDARFLAGHGAAGESGRLFRWRVPLRAGVAADLCSHKVSGSAVELRLVKASPGRWNALRPPALPPPAARTEPSSGGDAAMAPRQQPRSRSSSPSLAALSIAGAGDQPDTTYRMTRPASPLPLALPAPPPAVPAELGLTGLDNIGNTCFLNAVIQCLANTCELRDYFADSAFQSDINQENPLGMRGQLALCFAVLLRLLWSGQHRSHNPHQLKALVARKASQFTGFAQHDAQEFMAFLLDGLHEDLNRVRVKPYTPLEEDGGRPEQEVASEAWLRYKLRDDSVIVDLFQGQYRSRLVCPACDKVSVTFDPFLYLSVPLPKKKRPLEVTLFGLDPDAAPLRYTLYVTAEAQVGEVLDQLAEKAGLDGRFVRLLEARHHRVARVYSRGMSVGALGRDARLLAFQLLQPAAAARDELLELVVVQRLLCPRPAAVCAGCRKEPAGDALRRCTRCYRASYCDLACQRDHWPVHRQQCRVWPPEPVGLPFVLSVPRADATYAHLCRLMEAFSRHSVNVFCVPVTAAGRARRESLGSETSSDSGKCTDTEEPPAGEETGSADSADGGPPPPGAAAAAPDDDTQLFFIKPVDGDGQSFTSADGARIADNGMLPVDLRGHRLLAMDWKTHRNSRPRCMVEDRPEMGAVAGPRQSPEPTAGISLDRCLQLFTEPEKLSPGEAWYCPSCKTHREAEKQMSLWRVPLNLIIQLKRFSFKDFCYRDKIDKMVDFPIRGLDLRPYLTVDPEDGRALYDLYGVINHHGGILGGHYTAAARCVDPLRPQLSQYDWRLFDDARVSRISEDRVVTQDAYLLFYRRRVPYAAPQRATDAEEID